MKYTRYDIKRKKSNNFIFGFIMISTLVFAFLIGTIISNIVFKNTDINGVSVLPEKNQSSSAKDVSNKIENGKKTIKYIVVQGGMFSKSEYLEAAKKNLGAYGNIFTVKEEKGTRVLLGVYTEEEGTAFMKTLSDKGVGNSKITFEVSIDSNNACDEEIIAIINAELDILTKLKDYNAKYYKTEDIKKWCDALEKVDDSSKNIAVLNEAKAHIKNMPSKLPKDKVPEYYTFIYNLLKKFTSK